MTGATHPFTLEQIDSGPVSLETLSDRGPVVLVFAHADCPTSTLTLRRLAALDDNAGGAPGVHRRGDARRARLGSRAAPASGSRCSPRRRRSRSRGPTGSKPCRPRSGSTPGRASRTRSSAGTRARTRRLLGTPVPEDDPARKPGCGARWTYDAAGGLDELEDMIERGWSDGLPVIPPTPERVEAMLGGADPSFSLGPVPPAHGEATLERLAACAVLAGCRPGAFPVVRAAAEAALEPGFNAHGIARHHAARRPDPRRQRARARDARDQQRHGSTRPRYAREHDDRPGAAPAPHADRRGTPRRARPGHARSSRQARDLLRRERGGEPLGAASRRAWLPRRHLDRDARSRATPRSRSPITGAGRPRSSRRRSPRRRRCNGARSGGRWTTRRSSSSARSTRCSSPLRVGARTGCGRRCSRHCSALPESSAAARPLRPSTRAPTTSSCGSGRTPDQIAIVVAGGEAGRFSAVFGPCNGMQTQVVTKEIRWNT